MSDVRQVHEWFLHRGLPLVLTRRVRSRALIERSAPMVSGVGAVISLTMMLGVLTLLLIAAPFALYLLHQTGTTLGEAGRRSAALLVVALFVFGLPFAASGSQVCTGRGIRVRDRRAARHLVDVTRIRLNRVVGVPLCPLQTSSEFVPDGA